MIPDTSQSATTSYVGNEVTRNFRNFGQPVYVNVYHLHWPNGLKMGAYHTGTVVYDREFGFGGHPFSSSGIFQTTPMDIDSLGEEISFKERLYMGRTYLSKKAVERLLTSLADEFRGDSYHLLHFNCNHFTAQFVDLLCHGVLPKWINRLARIVSGLPLIESFLPPHWVRPSLMYDYEFDDLSDDEEDQEENTILNDQTPHLVNESTINSSSDNDNHIVCYKQDGECIKNSDLCLVKSSDKSHFQFIHSTSTSNGHVPHNTKNSFINNNENSVEHSDNHHHDSLLCHPRVA
ncbi:Deubiquitinase DESI2 [Schistosoma japonicum]|nr:Deubiquitinase DESI2 [Schistosoma japonicum]